MQSEQESEIRKRELQLQQELETVGNPLDETTNSNESPVQTCANDDTVIIVHGKQNTIDWYGVGLQILTNCFLVGTNVAVYKYFIKRWFHEDHAFLQLIKGIALEPVGLSLLVFYEIIFFLAFVSYQFACLSNPGYMTGKLPVPKHIVKKDSIEFCYRCLDKKWKPKRAHHCRICRKCVFRMDHHCNWVNNCVGVKTQKFFILFLIYAFVYSLLTMIYLTASGILLFVSIPKVFAFLMEISWHHFICGALWLSSIWFMYMTIEFLSDQIDSINENSTTVESFKSVTGMPNTFWNNVRALFGDNKLTWLLPIKPAVKCNYLEMLYTQEQIEVIKSENAGFIENIFNDPTDEQYQEINKYKVI